MLPLDTLLSLTETDNMLHNGLKTSLIASSSTLELVVVLIKITIHIQVAKEELLLKTDMLPQDTLPNLTETDNMLHNGLKISPIASSSTLVLVVELIKITTHILEAKEEL